MRIFSLTIILILYSLISYSQSFEEEIIEHRQQFKKEIVAEERAPLKTEDLQYLRYYAPDSTYRVAADFSRTENAVPFDIPTSSGKTKKYVEYGKVKFTLHKNPLTLTLYQAIAHLDNPKLKEYLFLPFTDSTNGEETYMVGRYLDFKIGDIKNNKLIIDFNKAYNPYCAYSGGYNCPKPPDENALKIGIRAGEMAFGKDWH